MSEETKQTFISLSEEHQQQVLDYIEELLIQEKQKNIK